MRRTGFGGPDSAILVLPLLCSPILSLEKSNVRHLIHHKTRCQLSHTCSGLGGSSPNGGGGLGKSERSTSIFPAAGRFEHHPSQLSKWEGSLLELDGPKGWGVSQGWTPESMTTRNDFTPHHPIAQVESGLGVGEGHVGFTEVCISSIQVEPVQRQPYGGATRH